MRINGGRVKIIQKLSSNYLKFKFKSHHNWQQSHSEIRGYDTYTCVLYGNWNPSIKMYEDLGKSFTNKYMSLGFSKLSCPLQNMDKCPHLSNLAWGMETYLMLPSYKECSIKYNQLNLYAKNE